MSNMVIVLRRELSCEDFGEITGDELKHLLSKAYSLRRNARNFQNMANAARREADHTAQSVLMFIFGGGEVQKRLKGFLDAQRRHAIISSVVDNLQRILDRAQDGLVSGGRSSDVETPVVPNASDLEQDEELKAARVEAERLQKNLRRHNMDLNQKALLLEEVRQKLTRMQKLCQDAAVHMQEEEHSIQHLEKYNQLLAGSGEGTTKSDVLNRILPALKQQAPDSVLGKRLRASFVVRALRTLDRSTAHEGEFDVKANDYLKDFRAVSERLGKDYQIRVLENPDSEDEPGRVTGVFDSGTRIYMDVFVENLSEVPSDTLITATEDDGVRTYVRTGGDPVFHSADRQ
jgi:sugar-specific transcriptional regulator TrmB